MSAIEDNLRSVRARIEAAASRSGRSGSDVTLVVVTKTRGAAEIEEAIACGAKDLGENYVQEAERKLHTVARGVRWHMIGHLQRNKAKAAVELFDMVHSVDSEALARELGKRAEAVGKCIDVLLEAQISAEQSKSGVEPAEVLPLAEVVSRIRGVRLCGLMGMAPLVADPEQTRPAFRQLKAIWDELPQEQRLCLSMGMTSDFEVAIEEGSNLVRIGTAIFGPRG